MKPTPLLLSSVFAVALLSSIAAEPPRLSGVAASVEKHIQGEQVAGAVTAVVDRKGFLHLEAQGYANREAGTPMPTTGLFAIASMTKPITAVAVLRLQDEGKLKLDDLVETYLPEFAELKTPSGKPARLTLAQVLSHTSGLSEGRGPRADAAVTLADLIPLYLSEPTRFEPGSKWVYCQSGINTAARVVEVVSGLSFDAYLEKYLFAPLGMKDTTFYPNAEQRQRLVTPYKRDPATGTLAPAPFRPGLDRRDRPPLANGGLYSTVHDYARFCRMLLNEGNLDGKRYLQTKTVRQMRTILTGDLVAGFLPGAPGHGWGVACGVVRTPQGVTAMLSPGSFGHGGAWGTQAWIDPVKGIAYLLMVQRTNFPNSDASDVRRDFQQAAADAWVTTRKK